LALAAISLAWIAGVWLGSNTSLAPFILSGWLVSFLLASFCKQRGAILVALLSLLALAGGAFYFQSSQPLQENSQISRFNGQGTVTMRGVVSLDPDVQDKTTRIKLSVDAISNSGEWQATSGMVMLYVPRYPQISYGDVLEVTGKLQTPVNFADFDYQAFLAKQSVFSIMDYPRINVDSNGNGSWFLSQIYHLRHGLSKVMAEALPEPQASLAQGIVLGLRGNIPADVNDEFARSGTTHILAVSGMNLTILSGLLSLMLARSIGKRFYLYVWLTLAVVWFYTLISGVSPSVLRAAIMCSLFLAAELLGRQKNAGPALCLAAAVMIGFNPMVLFDVSFQLSALSMAGIVFVYPILRDAASGIMEKPGNSARWLNAPVGFITESFSMTLAATLAVWPASAVYFGTVSLAAPLATLLAVPVLPFIMVLGSFMALAGLFYLPLAIATGWALWVFESYLLLVVRLFSSIPGSAIATGDLSQVVIAAYYALTITVVWVLTRHRRTTFMNEMAPVTE
jgi:competence protein ComEC